MYINETLYSITDNVLNIRFQDSGSHMNHLF